MGVKAKALPARLMLLLLLLAAFALAPGCRGDSNTLDIAGSTTVQPLAEKLAIAYMNQHPEIEVVVTGGGSSTGIRSVANGG